MTDPLFIGELSLGELDPTTVVGSRIELTGAEGHHAAAVRRIRVGEQVIIADGRGHAVRGPTIEVGQRRISVEAREVLSTPVRPLRVTVAQALAKGDRSELAIEMLTELGVDEIWPWQASRSIVRWTGERGDRSRARWRSTVREATKQSRRFRVPVVGEVVTSRQLAARVDDFDRALILHEDASTPLAAAALPRTGSLLIIVGPEGGIGPEELDSLSAAGAVPVIISDGVLRTSTAGVVALAAVLLR